MGAMTVSFQQHVLPFAGLAEDDERFRRVLYWVLAVVVLLCLAMLLIPPPKVDRTQAQELPPRFAKLLIEREMQPPPKPLPQKADTQAPKAEPAPGPTPKPPTAKPEPSKEAPVPEARRPVPNKAPGEVDGARRKAAGVGLLAMKDTLAEIRGAPLAVQLKQDIKPGKGVGTGVGVGVGAGTEPGLPDRAMITSNATGGSGGINTAGYSRDTGGGGLAGRATTLVAGVAGGGGGGGAGGGGQGGKGYGGNGTGGGAGAAGKGGTLTRDNSGKASRSIEEVKVVFDRNKGAIYAIYNRALRDEPGLQGKVVLSLTIAPSGQVTHLSIVSSELKSPELEQKLLARIRQFDFGAKDVNTLEIRWPVDFLPS